MSLVMLAVSLLMAAPALAWNEPGDFRGVPWGASVEEAKARVPTLVCLPLMGTCRKFFELGPAKVYRFWTFRNGGFDQIDLPFVTGHGAATIRTKADPEEAARRRPGGSKSD